MSKQDDKAKQLFRKTALEHHATPDQLDRSIKITGPRAWLVLLTLLMILITVLAWSILGSIATRVEGQGILVAEKGSIFAAVAPEGQSYIKTIKVHSGQQVKKNQILVELDNPGLKEKIKITQEFLTDLTKQHTQLSNAAKVKIAERKSQLAKKKHVLENMKASETKKLAAIEKLLKIRQEAFNRKLETRQRVVETVKDYHASLNEVERLKDQILELSVTENSFVDQWKERIRTLNLKIGDEQHKLNTLNVQLNTSQVIRSPITGIVTTIQKSIGELVNSGDAVVSIASPGQGMDAIIFIQPQDGKRVKVKMDAFVSPSIVKKEEYGSIRGKVITVSSYPISSEALSALLHNDELVKEFTKQGSPIAVRIRLIQDKSTFSGFQWTSSSGPEQLISPGNLATAQVTVREQPPITLLVPTLRKLLGTASI